MNYIITALAGFLSGLIGSMGFGGGGVLIIYLTLFAHIGQMRAQGINLLFFIPCALLSIIIYALKKQVDYRSILPVIFGGAVGAIGASFILKSINTAYLSKIFAVFLIYMGISSLVGLKKKK